MEAQFLYTVVQSQKRTCTTECRKAVAMSRCPVKLYLIMGKYQSIETETDSYPPFKNNCPIFRIYVAITDRAKFECGKWRATVTAMTHAEAVPASLSTLYLVPMWSIINGGLPLLALPFFRVVYVDTDDFQWSPWYTNPEQVKCLFVKWFPPRACKSIIEMTCNTMVSMVSEIILWKCETLR